MDSLSLSDKATVVTGGNVSTGAGDFPGLRISDGQQGVLNSFFVSGWSQPGSLTMSWDKDAMYKQSKAIAREYAIRGIHVVDGPTVSPLGRQPWTGRLMEAFASDSYLSGIALGIAARAEVDEGVISGGKVSPYRVLANVTSLGANMMRSSTSCCMSRRTTGLRPWKTSGT